MGDSNGPLLEGNWIDEVMGLLPEPRSIPAGVTLVSEDERAGWIGLLCSGLVKISYAHGNGNESTLGLRAQGYWINPEEILISLPSRVSLSTITSVSLIKVPTADFKTLLANSHPIGRYLLRAQLEEAILLQRALLRLRG